MLALRLVPLLLMVRALLLLLDGGDTKPAASDADLMAMSRAIDRDCMVLLCYWLLFSL